MGSTDRKPRNRHVFLVIAGMTAVWSCITAGCSAGDPFIGTWKAEGNPIPLVFTATEVSFGPELARYTAANKILRVEYANGGVKLLPYEFPDAHTLVFISPDGTRETYQRVTEHGEKPSAGNYLGSLLGETFGKDVGKAVGAAIDSASRSEDAGTPPSGSPADSSGAAEPAESAGPEDTIPSYYVSAAGSDYNNGRSEATAYKTLHQAVEAVKIDSQINTITIVGTLTVASEGDAGNEYNLFRVADSGPETVLIRGIRNGAFSGLGSPKNLIVFVGKTRVRLENISFLRSGRLGMQVGGGSTVTLGNGVVVSGSASAGIYVAKTATLTIETGEISLNSGREDDDGTSFGGGLYIDGGTVLMQGGVIEHNTDTINYGGGVYLKSGTFTLTGGSITGNTAIRGGGVYAPDGGFTMMGGTIRGNTNGNVVGRFIRNGGDLETDAYTQ